MPRIEVDDRGTTGISRIFRTLFIFAVFAYIIVPFLDDAVLIGSIASAGKLNVENLGNAIRVSLAMHRGQVMLHILACTVGVGMVIFMAQRDDSSAFVVAPVGTSIAIGLAAVIGRLIPVPEVGVVNDAILRSLEGGPMLRLANNFGLVNIEEYVIITSFFLFLGALGFVIKYRHDAEDAAKSDARGQKPEGWGSSKTD